MRPRFEPYESLADRELRFACLAEGHGPLVLLLHGFPDTAHTWDHVRPVLARAGYRAVSPNLRGYHPTGIPKNGRYDPETLARDAIDLIDALGDGPAILVGHDWGASIAYSVGAIAPERVRMIVTIGVPHPASLKPRAHLLWEARHALAFRLPGAERRVRRHDFAYVDALYRRWSPRWNPTADETAAVKEAFRHPGCLEAALAYYKQMGFRLPPSQREPVRVPAVAFAGVDDPVIPTSAYDDAASCFEAGYHVVRMPGGHFLHREHRDRFSHALLEVLAAAPVPITA